MGALQTLPRGPLERRSGTLDFPDAYERKIERFREALLKQAQNELSLYAEFQEVEKYISYLDGSGWWDIARPPYRSKFYDNYLSDQRRESLAALSDIRPVMEISCKVKAYEDQAKIAHSYVRYLWDEYDLDLKLVDWMDHALFGTGFLKCVAYEPGEFEFSAHGLDTVHPVGMNSELQSADAVVYTTFKSLGYFINRFGADKCVGLERQSVHLDRQLGQDRYARPEHIPQYTWNAMAPPMRRMASMRKRPQMEAASTETQPFPVIELTEIYLDDWSLNEQSWDVLVKHPDLSVEEHNYHYIVPPKCRLYPRKRLMIFGGRRLMYDGPAPFWDGQYPLTMLQLNPCVWSPGGISKYRDLIPHVRFINRIMAGMEENVMQALNRNIIGKRGAIPEATWDAFIPSKPGQKLLLNPVAQREDLRWMDPPVIPAYVMDSLRYSVDTIKRRSGALDIMGLSRKKQVPGGDTIENMRDAQSSPFRLEGRYVERALKQAGKQVVSRIFQFCTLDQRLKVLGADGMTYEDFDYKHDSMVPASSPAYDHWKLFPIHIGQGSLHGSSKTLLKQVAIILRRSRDLSLRGLYRILEFPEQADQIMQELQEEAKMGIGVQPAKGRTERLSRGQRTGSPV